MLWRSLPAVRRRASVTALTLVLLALSACGGGGASPSPSPSPTLFTPGPVGDSTVTPTPPPPDTPYRFVYREFGDTQDVIWRVLPTDPSQREQLAVIPHRQGWGINPSLSPDGRRLAYLSQPEGALDAASSQAEAHLIDLKTQKSGLIAQNVDLQFRPLWSPDGRLLFLRRYAGPEFLAADVMVLQVTVPKVGEPIPKGTPTPAPSGSPPDDSVRVVLKESVSQVLAFVPIGFADDKKSLLFVQVAGGTGGGTLLGAYSPASVESIATATAEAGATVTAVVNVTATAASEASATVPPEPPVLQPLTPTLQSKLVVRLSEQSSLRDYALSPDRRRLTFLAQDLVEGRFVNQAFVADLAAQAVQRLPSEGLAPGDQLRPLWHPDSQRVAIGILPSSGEPGAVALAPVAGGAPTFLPPPAAGFDVPRAWAPDGVWLAVTNFSGDSLANPGKARLDLVAPTGQRVTVAEGADNATEDSVLGWYTPQ